MGFKFLPDIALADVAFEASSNSVNGLFESCAAALTEVMVDPRTVKPRVTRDFEFKADSLDRLLYDFLTELIVVKDVDSLLFSKYQVSIAPDEKSIKVVAKGEAIDRGRHKLRNDAKAVTMHMFGVTRAGRSWKATVVLDI